MPDHESHGKMVLNGCGKNIKIVFDWLPHVDCIGMP